MESTDVEGGPSEVLQRIHRKQNEKRFVLMPKDLKTIADAGSFKKYVENAGCGKNCMRLKVFLHQNKLPFEFRFSMNFANVHFVRSEWRQTFLLPQTSPALPAGVDFVSEAHKETKKSKTL